MAKKVVSSVPVHTEKLTKRDNKKKKLLLNLKRVLDFLKSDNYMFAPLLSSHTSNHVVSSTNFTGIEVIEPMKEKNEKMCGIEMVKDYMQSDCYMYAPLGIHQPRLHSSMHAVNPASGPVSFSERADTGRKGDLAKNVAEETGDLGKNIKGNSIADRLVDGYPYGRSDVIKHTLLQQETVKHVIKQNYQSSSVQGGVKTDKKGGKGAKLGGSKTRSNKKKRVAWS